MSEITLSEPFREGGFWFKVGDYQFRLTCLCGVEQELDRLARRVRDDGVTVYRCKHCNADIAGVTLEDRDPAPPAAGQHAVNDDGHRMCGYVFGAKVDMELWPPAAVESFLQIPRRPGFFERRGLA